MVHQALSNMAQHHVAFCEHHVAFHECHVALLQCHVALHVSHVALLIYSDSEMHILGVVISYSNTPRQL